MDLKPWVSAVLGAALACSPRAAGAQTGFSARARFLGGYTHQSPAAFGSAHDLWAGVLPELSYLALDDPRGLLRFTYAFTGTLHTRDATEIANRLTVESAYELSSRTTLLLSAEAYQTSLTNYLVTQPVIDNPVVVLPSVNTRLLTSSLREALAWEASPDVTLGETIDATSVRSLDPEMDIDNVFVSGGVSAERTWKVDGLGAEVRGGYASLHTAPLPDQRFVTLTGAPRWRRDYTPELSSSLSGGASVVLGPDGNARTIVVPYARAALLYGLGPTLAELSYFGGAQPSALTGQMLRSHSVTLRGTTPLSQREAVVLGGSVGGMHGAIIDLRPDAAPTDDFDAVLANADVSWAATSWLQVFVRGLVTAQTGAGAVEASVREAVTVGVQLSTSPGTVIPLRLPQRVDGSDRTPLR